LIDQYSDRPGDKILSLFGKVWQDIRALTNTPRCVAFALEVPPMKILLTGLQRDFDVDDLRGRMSRFGHVIDIQVVRDGDPEQPWALVEMALNVAVGTEVARRIDGIYHIDRFIHARVMLHD